MKSLLFLVVLLSPIITPDGEPISVHVKEVHRTQDENTGKGNWLHIAAVVETKTVTYSLKCDEFLSTEKHDYTLKCYNLSAGVDYSARLFATAMSFWKSEEKGKGYMLVEYDITDEKEK
jgi:hypothetical protein